MMHNSLRSLSRRAIAALLLAGAVAACQPNATQYQPVEAQKPLKVDLQVLNHAVRFAPGNSTLSRAEIERLSGFLESAEVEPNDQVFLQATQTGGVQQARRQRVVEALSKRGVRSSAMPVSATTVGDNLTLGDEVVVRVERYVVTPPACPNWTKPAGADYTNTLPSNFGCATQTNLGLMIANPRDLVVGRVPGPGQIDRQLKIEQDFRDRKGQVLPCDMVGCPAGPPSKGEAP